jgi:hypothetical protein
MVQRRVAHPAYVTTGCIRLQEKMVDFPIWSGSNSYDNDLTAIRRLLARVMVTLEPRDETRRCLACN